MVSLNLSISSKSRNFQTGRPGLWSGHENDEQVEGIEERDRSAGRKRRTTKRPAGGKTGGQTKEADLEGPPDSLRLVAELPRAVAPAGNRALQVHPSRPPGREGRLASLNLPRTMKTMTNSIEIELEIEAGRLIWQPPNRAPPP